MKEGQRVRLVNITPELLKRGIRLGMVGTVRVKGPDLLGHPGFVGVEFDGHSDTGWNEGLQVITVNTQRDGQSVPVLSLCEPLEA